VRLERLVRSVTLECLTGNAGQVFLGVNRFWVLRDIDAVAGVESLGCWGKESRCSLESSFDFLPVLTQGVRHGNRFTGILPFWC
jgi:hypothetical protein